VYAVHKFFTVSGSNLQQQTALNLRFVENDNRVQPFDCVNNERRRNMMSKTSALAFAGVVLGSALCASAWAFPAAPVDSRAASDVIPVAEGCGPGYHRNVFGHCRPNEFGREFHRGCGFGWHYSVYRERCVPN
jgi:hypothetical protein